LAGVTFAGVRAGLRTVMSPHGNGLEQHAATAALAPKFIEFRQGTSRMHEHARYLPQNQDSTLSIP